MIKMRRKVKGVCMTIDPEFHRKINDARIEFMKKNNLDRLSTVAFTRILANKKALGLKNVQRKKRRR